MTRRSFYTMALWLPVAWPVVISLGEAFLHAFTWHQMSRVSGLIILSGLFGGIQYVLFAALISFKFATKDTAYITRTIWLLPLAFTAIFSIGIWCFFRFVTMQASLAQVRTSELDPVDITAICSNITLFSLGMGYGYLFVLQALITLLEALGVVEE